jgi:hypothetical protein
MWWGDGTSTRVLSFQMNLRHLCRSMKGLAGRQPCPAASLPKIHRLTSRIDSLAGCLVNPGPALRPHPTPPTCPGVEMLLSRGARVDLPCTLSSEVLGGESDGDITSLEVRPGSGCWFRSGGGGGGIRRQRPVLVTVLWNGTARGTCRRCHYCQRSGSAICPARVGPRFSAVRWRRSHRNTSEARSAGPRSCPPWQPSLACCSPPPAPLAAASTAHLAPRRRRSCRTNAATL